MPVLFVYNLSADFYFYIIDIIKGLLCRERVGRRVLLARSLEPYL